MTDKSSIGLPNLNNAVLQLNRKKPRLGRFLELKNLAQGYQKYFTLKGAPGKGKLFCRRYMRRALAAR